MEAPCDSKGKRHLMDVRLVGPVRGGPGSQPAFLRLSSSSFRGYEVILLHRILLHRRCFRTERAASCIGRPRGASHTHRAAKLPSQTSGNWVPNTDSAARAPLQVVCPVRQRHPAPSASRSGRAGAARPRRAMLRLSQGQLLRPAGSGCVRRWPGAHRVHPGPAPRRHQCSPGECAGLRLGGCLLQARRRASGLQPSRQLIG